ncbi:MAG: integrase/recombinase XerD [Actinomycetota bacterium]|nr:integrase/recombinase XerD [Actinomycetota bacterium]MDQ1385063.1 integrase/recombinase XerD [Actinomycetota bacterium]
MVRRSAEPGFPTVTLAVAAFLDACRSSNTRAAYRADLEHIAAWCRGRAQIDLFTIDASDVARYRTECELAGASPATVARRLSAITSFGAFAAANGTETALSSETGIARPTVDSESTAELLSDGDADALLAAADRISRRSAALIRLLMLDGLKVGDIIRADVNDVSGRPPRITLPLPDRRVRTVPVPDRRIRSIDLHPDTAAALRRYVGRRRKGPLLLSERRGCEPDRLTRFGLDYLIKQVVHEAGLARPVSGNTLRRRYVMAAHAGGADLDKIRHNTGHMDRRTTRRYLDTRGPAAPEH